MTVINKETTDWWKETAKDEGGRAGETRTYPDKVLTLIAALEMTAVAVTRHGECICGPWHPDMSGPEEWCSQHGRPYHDAIAYLSSIVEAQRFALERALKLADYGVPVTPEQVRDAVRVRVEDYTYPFPGPEVTGQVKTLWNEEGPDF